MIKRIAAGLAGILTLGPGSAFAQGEPTGLPIIGAPAHGPATGFQPAVTEVAHDLHWLDSFVHGIMAVIVVFVTALLLYVIFRFNHRSNPTPARFTHNTKVEIAWTLVPVLILIVIGSLSLPILFKQLEIPEPDLTVKATGNQWYWTYDYTDFGMSFDSLMLAEDELAEHGYSEDLYRLATDTSVVVPVNAVVRLQTTGADVIHSWAMPAFGVKMDAVPGRLNETWFSADTEGVYFGQCSELCGKDHSYMPITVKVVSREAYETWLDWALGEYGGSRGEEIVAEVPAGAASAAETEADADVEAAVEAGAAEAPEAEADGSVLADEAEADDASLESEADPVTPEDEVPAEPAN